MLCNETTCNPFVISCLSAHSYRSFQFSSWSLSCSLSKPVNRTHLSTRHGTYHSRLFSVWFNWGAWLTLRRTLLRCWWTIVAEATEKSKLQRDQPPNLMLIKTSKVYDEHHCRLCTRNESKQESLSLRKSLNTETQIGNQTSVPTCIDCKMSSR